MKRLIPKISITRFIISLVLISIIFLAIFIITNESKPAPISKIAKSSASPKVANKESSSGLASRRLTDIPSMVNTFADIIIIGRVERELGVKYRVRTDMPEIKFGFTNYSVAVEEVVMGLSESTITVSISSINQPDSTPTNQFMDQTVLPSLNVGERVLLFLARKRVLPPEDWREDPIDAGTYVLPSSQYIYRLDANNMAHSAFYYKSQLPDYLKKEYPFLIRDKKMSIASLIAMIQGYIKSGDTGFGRKSKAAPYGTLPGQINTDKRETSSSKLLSQ